MTGKGLIGLQEQWANLHPLSHRLRVQALAQLQPLAELQVGVGVFCNSHHHFTPFMAVMGWWCQQSSRS